MILIKSRNPFIFLIILVHLSVLELSCIKWLTGESGSQLTKFPDDSEWKDSRVSGRSSEYLGLGRTGSPVHPRGAEIVTGQRGTMSRSPSHAHPPSISCLQLSPDLLAPVRGNLHSWVQRLIFPPACLFLLNNVTQKGGHGKQRCWVFLDELSIQESLRYWGKRHGLSLSTHGNGGLLLLGLFLPSHFAKIFVQRLCA